MDYYLIKEARFPEKFKEDNRILAELKETVLQDFRSEMAVLFTTESDKVINAAAENKNSKVREVLKKIREHKLSKLEYITDHNLKDSPDVISEITIELKHKHPQVSKVELSGDSTLSIFFEAPKLEAVPAKDGEDLFMIKVHNKKGFKT